MTSEPIPMAYGARPAPSSVVSGSSIRRLGMAHSLTAHRRVEYDGTALRTELRSVEDQPDSGQPCPEEQGPPEEPGHEEDHDVHPQGAGDHGHREERGEADRRRDEGEQATHEGPTLDEVAPLLVAGL